MAREQALEIDERTRGAIMQMQDLIRARYPEALFSVAHGDDPEGVYLRAIIDVDDVEEVIDVFRDRLLEMQIGEGLPLYVIPLEPVERVLDQMRSHGNLPPRYRAVHGGVARS